MKHCKNTLPKVHLDVWKDLGNIYLPDCSQIKSVL